MQHDIRCGLCGRKLAEAEGVYRIKIKCTRCRKIHSATSAPSKSEALNVRKTHNPLDGR